MPGTDSFDELFSSDLQDRWVHDLEFVDAGGERPDDEEQRSRYADRFCGWSQRYGDVVGRILRTYVPLAVPAFERTEWVWWSVSCLESRSSRQHPVTRISINWQEVICIWKDEKGFGAYFQVARSPLDAAYGNDWAPVLKVAPSAEMAEEGIYEAGGADQVRLFVDRVEEIEGFLRLKPVGRAIRKLNLGVMRKGKTPWPRSHCFQVADLIYESHPTPTPESRPRTPRRS
jgi:hypothetical protein